MFKAKDVMSSPVVWVPPTSRVIEAVKLMVEKNIGCVIVGGVNVFLPVEKLGILTERDITRLVADGRDIENMAVAECMSTPFVTVDVDATLVEVSDIMVKHNFRRIPVVYAGKVVGIVTSKDVTRTLRYCRAKWIAEHKSDDKL
ncbi:MAG: CBS domain-containing protein [Candidatus Altiarchaeota archaeon]